MGVRERHQHLFDEAQRLKGEGRFTDALAAESRAAQILEETRRHIQAHPQDAESSTGLLFLADRQWALEGDVPEVQSMLAQALTIRENLFGLHSPEVAEILTAWADVHFLASRWSLAEPMYRRALTILEAHGNVTAPQYSACQGGLAQCLSLQGQAAEADSHFEKAIQTSQDTRLRYFFLVYRAEGLEKMNRAAEAAVLRTQALDLLPKANPGENGFQV